MEFFVLEDVVGFATLIFFSTERKCEVGTFAKRDVFYDKICISTEEKVVEA